MYLQKFIIILFFCISFQTFAQEIAVLKYNGGGDWYANPTAIPNLIEFSNKHTNTLITGFVLNEQGYLVGWCSPKPPIGIINCIIL